MDELNAYTLREFTLLPDDERELYKAFGLKLKPSDLGLGDILEWEWGRVKQIQDLLNQPTVSYEDLSSMLSIALKKTASEIYEMKWFEVFRLYNYISDGMKRVNEIEEQLSHEPSADEVNAGIDQYNEFSWFVTLHRLAGEDILKHNAVAAIPYCEVTAVLKLRKLDSQFNRNMMKRNGI